MRPANANYRLSAGDQSFEARVAPEWSEGGIDFEPAGREVIRHPEQRLELVERLLRLSDQQVDAHEVVLEVGPYEGVPADGHDRDRALPFLDRLRLPAQVGQGHTQVGMALGVLGCRAELLLKASRAVSA